MAKRRDVYREAVELWGEEFELDMVVEECLELCHVIFKYKRGKTDFNKVIEVVKGLHRMGVILKLSTTRLNPHPFGGESPDETVTSGLAKEHITNWLQDHNVLHCFQEITGYKPYADIYIDDRGWDPPQDTLLKRIEDMR